MAVRKIADDINFVSKPYRDALVCAEETEQADAIEKLGKPHGRKLVDFILQNYASGISYSSQRVGYVIGDSVTIYHLSI